jgi:hypothetical protein
MKFPRFWKKMDDEDDEPILDEAAECARELERVCEEKEDEEEDEEHDDWDDDEDEEDTPSYPSNTNTTSPFPVVSGSMVCSGIMPPAEPDYEAIGDEMVVNIDRMSSKEIGEVVVALNEQLEGMTNESMSRAGWDTFDRMVKLFEELTAYRSND